MATRWVALRLVLLVLGVALAAYALLTHTTPAPLRALYEDVAAGEVEQVQLTPGLSGDATGPLEQTATWRTGLRAWRTDVVLDRGAGADPGSSSGSVGQERTADDLAEQLRQRDPSVRIETAAATGILPPLVIGAGTGLVTALVLMLMRGPEPWRATRWGWAWLCLVPGGALAFLLLSGPVPGLPRWTGQRLGGRRAAVWSAGLGLLVTGALLLLADSVYTPHP